MPNKTDVERGHPLKGESREKTPPPAKKSLFSLGTNIRTSTASFSPLLRTRYFCLIGLRSSYSDPHQSPIGI